MKFIRFNKDTVIQIVFSALLIMILKGCYELLHIDYLIVDYVADNNIVSPIIFRKDGFIIKVKYLGTEPNISDYTIYEISHQKIISYIEFKRSEPFSKKLHHIKIVNCHLIINNEDVILPYTNIRVTSYPTEYWQIKFNDEFSFLKTKFNLDDKDKFIIEYIYPGDFKDIMSVDVELNLQLSIDGILYNIEKIEKLKRKQINKTSWGPLN